MAISSMSRISPHWSAAWAEWAFPQPREIHGRVYRHGRPGHCAVHFSAPCCCSRTGDAGHRRPSLLGAGRRHADYKLASTLLVLSIWPSMVNSISAQANVARKICRQICRLRHFNPCLLHRNCGNGGVPLGRGRRRRIAAGHANRRFSGAFLSHAQARARLGDTACSSAGIAQAHDSLCVAERCQHGGGADRLGPVGDYSAQASLRGYPPGVVLFAGIHHGRTVAAGRDHLRNGSRRHDLSFSTGATSPGFPPSQPPRSATLP
jgi:hypothetical protein